ncbi:MAG: GNAT family N-acetyltransferase [Paracoccaceae bacterium]
MSNIIIRPFLFEDRPACLSIFDSNVPLFFSPKERVEFNDHLKNLVSITSPYIVVVRGGAVVACGGLTVDFPRQRASLSWGMVDRASHGQQLGSILTHARLTLARSISGLTEIELSTSQHTHGFYGRFGFVPTKVTLSGFGPGLDRWDMTLKL